MSKRFLIFALLTLAIGGVIVVYTHSQHFWNADKARPVTEQQLVEFAAKFGQTNAPTQSVLAPLDLSRPVRLVVGGLGLADNDQNQQLGDLVTAELTGVPGFNLVERQSLNAILRELNLSLSGFVRAKDAVRVGKLLKADWFLLGTEAKINGTNSIVIRVVDARTGVMRDAGVVSASQSPAKLAADVAAFVRQSRQDAASAKTRVYLAVGAFEDLSVNNRQADFPVQLRGYLTAAYRGSSVTLLEREYVETLLQEVDLDIAGLTEENSTNPPPPMQSAFWLVFGQYQSYETTNLQVELNLYVRRVFGKSWHRTLRGLPGESVSRQTMTAIDEVMNQNSGAITLSRTSEAQAQLALGKDLLRPYLSPGFDGGIYGLVYVNANWDLDPNLATIQKRNVEEAMRAFETVLLLEPASREAKMYLAACLRTTTIYRLDDARIYYREIIEEPVQDEWSELAQKALLQTFEGFWSGGTLPDEEASWFEAAAQHATNPTAVAFFRSQAEVVRANIAIKSDASQTEKLAETNLFAAIQAFDGVLHGGSGVADSGMSDFVDAFGTNRIAAAKRIAELIPEMKRQTPDLGPYLSAEAVSFQVDTNAPIIAEFRSAFEQICEHTNQVFGENYYWGLIGGKVYDWSIKHKLYNLAAELMEGKVRAVANHPNHKTWNINDDDKMSLAYAYMGAQEWEKALTIFETYSNQPVKLGKNGPWGRMFSRVFPAKEADYCRQKLGLPAARDPREFNMGNPVLCLCPSDPMANPYIVSSAFATDDNGLWVGMGGQLLHLDFDLKTNLVIKLPMDDSVPITALCLTSSNIWIGTGGAGLIEFNKASRQCRLLTEKDGLLMENIASLQLTGDTLWIGYGQNTFRIGMVGPHTQPGRLGKLDLTTGHFASFTPSLSGPENGNTEIPARYTVTAMAAGAAGDIWLLTDENATTLHLLRYQPNSDLWKGFQNGCTALAGNQKQIVLAQSVSPVLSLLDFKDAQWRSLKGTADLPPTPVSTLMLDGNNLWVGGMGYIALVDTVQDKVLRFAYVHTDELRPVDRIQIGGGYVWAQFDWHLYRALIDDSQHEFLQRNFAKFVPIQFQKDTNGAAVLQRLHVNDNMFEHNGNYYCGFKFTIPPWFDGDLRLLYILAKSEAEKDFSVKNMNSNIIPENGPSAGSYDYLREGLASYPQLQTRFPYTGKLTTQNFDMKQLEPGKTYGIWFEFDGKNMPDIAFAMTVNSQRGTNEFGILPLR